MTNQEKFQGLNFDQNPYLDEAKERWGKEKVEASQTHINNLSDSAKFQLGQDFDAIYQELADLRQLDPTSDQAQLAIAKWYTYLNENFGNFYTPEVFRGLGQLYIEDQRFTHNIDQYGQGLAQFMCQAMTYFADKHL